MNIHEHTALLDAFVDGQLTAEEMTEVKAHLADCPDCRAYVDDALTIRASFPTEEEPAQPEGFAGRVMQAVAKAPQSRPKKQPWGRLAAAAACLALVILVQHGVETSSLSGSTDTAAYEKYDKVKLIGRKIYSIDQLQQSPSKQMPGNDDTTTAKEDDPDDTGYVQNKFLQIIIPP